MRELTLKIPHKAAARLGQALGMITKFIDDPQERIYFQSLLTQVRNFAATSEPVKVKITVIARDGVPVNE